MPSTRDLKDMTQKLGDTLDAQYKTRGADITARLPKLKRKLPKKLGPSLERISAAERRAKAFPQLSQGALDQVAKDKSRIEAHVQGIDRAAQRKQNARGWAVRLILNIALMIGALALWRYIGVS